MIYNQRTFYKYLQICNNYLRTCYIDSAQNMKKAMIHQSDEYNLYHKSQKLTNNTKNSQQYQKQMRNGHHDLSTGNGVCKNQGLRQNQMNYDKQYGKQQVQIRKNDKQDDQTKASKDQSNISNQLSTTMEYENQIERLSIEIIAKNKQIATLSRHNQKKKVQIIELEKNKNYIQGKLKMMEQQLSKYESVFIKLGKQSDQRAKTRSQVEQLAALYQSMRKSNEQLNGKYEQKCYQLNKLTQKYIKLKGKMSDSKNSTNNSNNGHRSKSKSIARSSQNSLMKRSSIIQSYAKPDEVQSQSQINQNNSVLQILNAKIMKIQQILLSVDQQNKKLNRELEEKDIMCTQLTKQLQKYHRKSLHSKQNSVSDKKLRYNSSSSSYRNSNSLRQNSTKQQYQLMTQPSVISSSSTLTLTNNQNGVPFEKNNSLSKIKLVNIFRKIKYNVITEQICYEDLINVLASDGIRIQLLVDYPYFLSMIEAEHLLKWLNSQKGINHNPNQCDLSVISTESRQKQNTPNIAQILQQKFPKYKPIMLRRQFSTKIYIYNTYQNRQQEFEQFYKNLHKKSAKYQQAEIYFENVWGLNQQQIDVLLKSYYDNCGNLEKVDYGIVKEVIKQWGKL